VDRGLVSAKEVFGVQGTGPKSDRFLTRSVRARGLVFTTLHHGFDPGDYDPTVEAGTLPDDLGQQTRNVLEELGKVLDEAGSGLDRALCVNLYVNSDEADALAQVDAAYHAFWGAQPRRAARSQRGPCQADGLGRRGGHGGGLLMDAWYLPTDTFVRLGPLSGLAAGPDSTAGEQTVACLTQLHPAYNDFFHSRGVLRKPSRSTAGVPLTDGELVRMTAIALTA
jgi:enamine deaminase RidA (YjgF/YER057c/UK114 family)